MKKKVNAKNIQTVSMPLLAEPAVMRSANLLRENTEIRDQQHEMWAEGSCDDEPTKEEVIAFVKTLGWVGRCVEISFDGMQTVWRWSCDIAHL